MKECLQNSPQEQGACEKSESREKLLSYDTGIKNIAKRWGDSSQSKETRELLLGQLQELQVHINKYHETPVKEDIESDEYFLRYNVKNNMRDALSFLSKGTERKVILKTIDSINNYGEGDGGENNFLFVFLPKEYMENEKIKGEILMESVAQGKIENWEAFSRGEIKYMSSFTNDDFKDHPDIIKKALSRSDTILSFYEDFKDPILRANPKFVETLNEILANEYPDFFGKIQDAIWYIKSGIEFDKISVLLDILKYGSYAYSKFIDMMSLAEKGETKKAYGKYDSYFSGTKMGNDIQIYFRDTQLISCIKEQTQKTLDEHSSGGNIYSILHKNTEARDIAQLCFGNIPKEDLEKLLKLLPIIEAQCPNGNINTLIESLDANGKIDIMSKQKFFIGLLNITVYSNKKDKQSDIDFYKTGFSECNKQMDVSTEKRKISFEEENGRKNFSVIKQNFPLVENGILDEKNIQLNHILNTFINKDGLIVTSGKDLKDDLMKIFEGCPLAEKLKGANGGKEALRIIATIASEKKQQTQSDIKKIDKSFAPEKISQLQKEKPEEYKKLRILLSGKESFSVKIKALYDNGVTTKQFTEGENLEDYITFVQGYFQDDTVLQYTKTTLSDTGKGGKLEAFESYYRGEISAVELNKTIQKRDQEIQKQEQEQKLGTKDTDRTDAIVPFNMDKKFTEIPVGQPMMSGSGNDAVFIHKNPDNTMSIYSPSGRINIDGIQIMNQDKPFKDIEKAMDSIQFLKESGLDIFRNDLPKIIDAVNNRVSRGAGNSIDITDGINTEEGFILLETIGKITQEKVEIKTRDDSQLNALKRQFSMEGGGFLSKLQNTGYAKNDQIDIEKITKSIKTMT